MWNIFNLLIMCHMGLVDVVDLTVPPANTLKIQVC